MAPWGSVKFMSNFDDVYYNAAFLGHCWFWWPCWMLIYKHEPFWQEVIVESLLLRWHFNNFSRITWANCNQSCNKSTFGRSADKGSHPFLREYDREIMKNTIGVNFWKSCCTEPQFIATKLGTKHFFNIKMANCTPLQGDIIVYKFQNTHSSILWWREFE